MSIKNRNKGLAAIFLMGCILLGGYVFITFFLEPSRDTKRARTEVRISSESLVSSFLVDERSANTSYVEKTIEVQGIVREITFLNDRYTVFLHGGDELACLMCDMQADQLEQVKNLKPGQKVLLKGVCKGFLMDAILLNCVLINTNQ
ncbi:hypothetical protein WIW50_01785 [Flavobacteriaceae bacterium 3-367]